MPTNQPSNAPPTIVVSHGYENIYERGFCNGLTDAGIPFILVSSDQTDYAGLRPGTRTVNLRGSQDRRRSRPAKLLNLIRYHAALLLYVLRNRRSAVHVMGLVHPPFLCGIIEGLWFRLIARRYLLTVHNLLPHDRETAWNTLVFRIAYRLASVLVVHTPKVKDVLVREQRIAPERIVVMEHGLEPLAKPLAAPPPRPPEAPLHLLFFGKVMRYKGVDILLDALRDFPESFWLTIAGASTDRALTADLMHRIESHPHRDRISWLNRYIEESEIEPLFLQADALVLPYRRIEQSGVLFQAMRYGLPIVVTDVGSLAAYAAQFDGLVVPPENSHALSVALIQIRELRNRERRDDILRLASRFDWKNTARALRKAYACPIDS